MSALTPDVLALAPDIGAAASLLRSRRLEVSDHFIGDLVNRGQKLSDTPENILFLLFLVAEAAGLRNQVRQHVQALELASTNAMHHGKLGLAISGMRRARVAAQNAFLNGEVAILNDLIASVQRLVAMEERVGNLADAREMLIGLRSILRGRGFRRAASWVDLTLAEVCRVQNDLPTGHHYLHSVMSALSTPTPVTSGDLVLPEPETVAQLAASLARRFYYDAGDTTAAEELATYAISVVPTDDDSLSLLAIIQLHHEEYAKALATWERFLDLRAESVDGHRNRALALSCLDRTEEAIEGLNRAIELGPTEPGLYLNRAARLATVGRYEEAIRDYERTIELFGDRRYIEVDMLSPLMFRSDHHTPVPYSIVDVERLLYQAFIAIHDHERAWKRIEILIAEKSGLYRFMGHHLASVLCREEKNEDRELEELDRALAFGDVPEIHRRRAEILIGRGDVAAALQSVFSLAEIAEDRSDALELMQSAAALYPDDPLVQKWLGFVMLKSAMREAEAVLTKAIEATPDDPDLWLFRGQALTIAVYLDDDPETTGIDLRRMCAGLRDLGKASRMNGMQAAEALRIYKWILDHLCFDDRIRVRIPWLEVLGNEDGPFLTDPNGVQGFIALAEGLTLAGEGEWGEAVPHLQLACDTFAALGLVGLAAQTTRHLADVYIRLNDLDRAAKHLDSAAELAALTFVPLSTNLQEKAREFREAALSRQGTQLSAYELEYLPLYLLGRAEFELTTKLLRCEVLRRRGNMKEALDALGDREAVLQAIAMISKDSDRSASPFRLLYTVFALYRETEMFDEAEALLPLLTQYAQPHDLPAALTGVGTLRLRKGDPDGAEEMFVQALAIETNIRPVWRASTEMNRASGRLLQGKPEEALAICEGLDAGLLTGAGLIQHRYTMAEAHEALGRPDQAREMISAAQKEFERVRTSLDLKGRISWQEQFRHLHEAAVDLELTRGNTARAFDLAEQARARALADHLAAGIAGHDPITDELVARESLLRNRRERFLRLQEQIRRDDVDPALLHEVVETEGDESDLVESRTPPRVNLSRLQNELRLVELGIEKTRNEAESRRTRHAAQTGVNALSFREAVALLDA